MLSQVSRDEEEPLPSWVLEPEIAVVENETAPLVGTSDSPLHSKHESYNAIDDPAPEKAADDNDEESSQDDGPKPPRKNLCLHVFGIFEMFAIVTCCRLLLMQLVPLFLAPLQEIGYLQITLRIYVSLCCFLFVLVELEVPISFIKNSTLLQNYVSRGFLYSFVGLIGTEESYAVFVQELKAESRRRHEYQEFHVAWETLFTKGASLIMVVLGFIYMILGTLCIRGLRERLRTSRREAMESYRQEKLEYEERKKNKETENAKDIKTLGENIFG